jgi:hypothetical protein
MMKRNNTDAFSLLESVIALGLGLGLLLFVKNTLYDAFSLQSFTKDRSVWQMLEDDLRRSFLDEAAFSMAKAQNPQLLTCVTQDETPCPAGPRPVKLFLTKDLPTTGEFSGLRSPCSQSGCPVKIEAEFTGVCRGATPCDMAGTIVLDYRILVDGALYRQGSMQRNNLEREASDDTLHCENNPSGEVGFVSRIGASDVTCINVPTLNRSITGIQPGDCVLGKEVLVGFEAGGQPICAPIKKGGS